MPGFGTAWNSWMIIGNWWEHISGVWIDIHKSRHIITDAGKVADVLSFCDKMLGEPSQLFSWLLYSQELFNGDSSLVMLLLIQLIITRIPVWIGLVEQQLPNFAKKDIRQKIWRWNYHKSFIFYGNFYDFNKLLDPTLPWSSDWRQFTVCNFPLQIFVCHAKLFCLSWVTFKSHDPICYHFKYLCKAPGFIVPRLSFAQRTFHGEEELKFRTSFVLILVIPDSGHGATVRVTNGGDISRRPDLAINECYVERLCRTVISVLSSNDVRIRLCSHDKSAFHAQIGLPFRYLCSGSLLPPPFTPKPLFFSRDSKLWAVRQSSLKLRQSKKQQHKTFLKVSFHLKPKDILQYFSLHVSCRLSP